MPTIDTFTWRTCANNTTAGMLSFRLLTHVTFHLYVQGTLRTALDKGMLKQPGAAYIDPALALLLARDVAAAMLHLHR